MQAIDEVKIICYDSKIYVQESLCTCVIDWNHFYLNHPGGSILAKTIREVCYWKGLVTQAELFTKTCKTCQQFKNIKTLYGHLPHKNIAELKQWDLVNVDLIDLYINSIRQQHPGSTIIWNNASLTWMTMIDLSTGWFEIVEILRFNLGEVTAVNDEYIDKPFDRVVHMFNNTCLCIYPCPRKVVFDNGSEFKRGFTPFLKDSNIKPVLTSIKKPQDNTLMKRVHQVILNMLVTKDLDIRYLTIYIHGVKP